MKFATMLSDLWESLRRKPITQQYPFERTKTPEHLRGMLLYDPTNCTGCGLCVKDCPANAIENIVLDKKAKRFVVRYHVDRCTFCAQCVASCRQECMKLANDMWELAQLGKDDFEILYGAEADVQAVMASLANGGSNGTGEPK
jgi:formate hydrogenlyase subunit 6/NADH:ubiquinone oxidoreductase subunit I